MRRLIGVVIVAAVLCAGCTGTLENKLMQGRTAKMVADLSFVGQVENALTLAQNTQANYYKFRREVILNVYSDRIRAATAGFKADINGQATDGTVPIVAVLKIVTLRDTDLASLDAGQSRFDAALGVCRKAVADYKVDAERQWTSEQAAHDALVSAQNRINLAMQTLAPVIAAAAGAAAF